MATAQLSTERKLTARELQSLAEAAPELSVSIYLPTVRSGREFGQNPVRLKNLLREAATRLHELKHTNRGGRTLEAESARLQEDNGIEELMREPSDGFALFLREGFVRAYRAPVAFEEAVHIGPRFHLTPLIEYVQGNGRYYVLAVSQKDVRLFEGDKHSIAEVSDANLPKNLVDALNIDEFIQSTQFHTAAPGGRLALSHGGGIFHGHSGGDQGEKKDLILEYFRRLDDALTGYFHDETAPLVFAGVDYLFPLYRECNHYRGLVDEAITGNPEGWGPGQLHEAAWKIVQPRFDAARREAIEQYGALAARRQASDYLPEIIAAAQMGRVGTLLLARGARQLGCVNPDTGDISLLDGDSADQQNAEDLLAYAASQTLGANGAVYLLDKNEMPTEAPAAGLFRY